VSAIFTACGVQQTGTRSITILATRGAGNALAFDNVDDFAQVLNRPTLDLGAQATIEFWLRIDAPPASGFGDWIVLKGGSGAPSSFGIALDATGHLVAEFRLDDPALMTTVAIRQAEPTPTGQWLHVTAVLDTQAAIARLYVNGVVVAETAAMQNGSPIPPRNIRNNQSPIWIGGVPLAPNTLNGRIEELRLWSVARQRDDIRSTMYRKLAGDEPDLLGNWRFDDGEGQIIGDNSLRGHNGHLGVRPEPDASDPTWTRSDAPIGPPPLPGDLNDDGAVDLADLGILLADFGCSGGGCVGDVDGDGDTDLADLGILLANFGTTCP
jgi:hypothetical protein